MEDTNGCALHMGHLGLRDETHINRYPKAAKAMASGQQRGEADHDHRVWATVGGIMGMRSIS